MEISTQQMQDLAKAARELSDWLAALLPPPEPGLPVGVMSYGPGTVIGARPNELAGMPITSSQKVTFLTDRAERFEFWFYPSSLVVGSRYILQVRRERPAKAYDLLYAALEAPPA